MQQKEKKKNIQIHKRSQQRDCTKVLKNTLSELQRPVIKHIATLQPATNTDYYYYYCYYVCMKISTCCVTCVINRLQGEDKKHGNTRNV